MRKLDKGYNLLSINNITQYNYPTDHISAYWLKHADFQVEEFGLTDNAVSNKNYLLVTLYSI